MRAEKPARVGAREVRQRRRGEAFLDHVIGEDAPERAGRQTLERREIDLEAMARDERFGALRVTREPGDDRVERRRILDRFCDLEHLAELVRITNEASNTDERLHGAKRTQSHDFEAPGGT